MPRNNPCQQSISHAPRFSSTYFYVSTYIFAQMGSYYTILIYQLFFSFNNVFTGRKVTNKLTPIRSFSRVKKMVRPLQGYTNLTRADVIF